MKKLPALLLIILFSGLSFTNAQTLQEKAKALVKPADIGLPDYDSFKNSSFSLKDEVLKTDKTYDQINKEIIKYSNGGKKLNLKNVQADIKKVKNVSTSLKTLNEKASTLAESGKKLSSQASNVKPADKVAGATSNTKTSLQAVDLSKDILKNIGKKVDVDTGTLNALLGKAIKKR